jgi:hypothetical protein
VVKRSQENFRKNRPTAQYTKEGRERESRTPRGEQEGRLAKEAELLVLHWHLHDRGGRLVLGIFLQLRFDFHHPTSRFLRINFSNVLPPLDFI